MAKDLVERSPTVLTAVPRLYEKIHEKLLDVVKEGGPAKVRVFDWARRTALQWADHSLNGRAVPAGLSLRYWAADKLVFSKLRARTGGRLRCSVSGGAPLNADIARFFYAAGMPILEGYGLTETSPVIAVNTFQALRIGSVGRLLPGVEVRIAEDGEIHTRGPNVMKGYYNRPEATAEALSPDGWFRTGDIGKIDADGPSPACGFARWSGVPRSKRRSRHLSCGTRSRFADRSPAALKSSHRARCRPSHAHGSRRRAKIVHIHPGYFRNPQADPQQLDDDQVAQPQAGILFGLML